jgi:hypothetical protein
MHHLSARVAARWTVLLTTICLIATMSIVGLPLVVLEPPVPPPFHPPRPASTAPLPSNPRILEQQLFGITRDRMMLYTAPGFLGTPLELTR